MTTLIEANTLGYVYNPEHAESVRALSKVDLSVSVGEFLAVVGHNGSGKSTLAKCLSGLFLPTEGDVWVSGMNTRDGDTMRMRSQVGTVFQHPENQFVASQVEDEVAFGPENLGLARERIRERVDWALAQTGLAHLRERNPQTLSAGDKALLAIAGVLAMQPACLVLDESTALLHPGARRRVQTLLQELRAQGLAVVLITHYMDEVVDADRIVVLDRGQIALQGTPHQVFAQRDHMQRLGLGFPTATALAHGLSERGATFARHPLTATELADAVLAQSGRS